MAKIIVGEIRNFTVMSNFHLRDENLSLKAKGLMSYMLSLPESWDFTIEGLEKVLKEGRDAIRGALQELEKEGYLKRNRIRNKKGMLEDMEYMLHLQPMKSEPMSEKATQENTTQINTKEINTEETSTNDNVDVIYKEELKEEKSTAKNSYENDFKIFWNMYPKKEAKANALKWFKKNNPNEELFLEIMHGLEKQLSNKNSCLTKEKVFIPLATTWLNGERWNDEIEQEEDMYDRIIRELEEEKNNDK